MSVGGKVIEVINIEPRKVWVNTFDKYSECAIYCDPSSLPFGEKIQPGDTLWWQGGFAYWTPKERHIVEFKIKKIGFSGISHKSAILDKVKIQ